MTEEQRKELEHQISIMQAHLDGAEDKSGKSYLYTTKPIKSGGDLGFWASAKGYSRNVDCFSSFKPGTCDWQDPLVCREDTE